MIHYPDGEVDQRLLASWKVFGGVDEVGRGALAGPLAVGVVVIDDNCGTPPAGIADSKALKAPVRQSLVGPIRKWARACAVGWSAPVEIGEIGVTGALRLAALRAMAHTQRQIWSQGAGPLGGILLDGKHDYLSVSPLPSLFSAPVSSHDPHDPWAVGPHGLPVATLVQADRHSVAVAAASVLAKVARDDYMEAIADPGYGWARNKGYGSRAHVAALGALGPSPRHRLSWRLPGVN